MREKGFPVIWIGERMVVEYYNDWQMDKLKREAARVGAVRWILGFFWAFLGERIFKRVKGRIAIRPYTATRNGGSRRYPAQKRAFGRYEPDSHSELKIAEILPHK